MRYMLSVPPEHALEADRDKWAPGGQPVVPWYPAVIMDAFVAVPSFKPALCAEVVDLPDFDPDVLASRLKKEYPGLPPAMHEEYVLAIAKAARLYPIGTKLQVFITPQTAKLRPAGEEAMHTLWEQQPIVGG